MTHDRWTSGDAELTDALRALYRAPTDGSYWDALEARILSYIAHADESQGWWSALADMVRPGLVAAAALVLAASLVMVRSHSQELEARSAYASVISPSDATEPAVRAASAGDGDIVVHYLLSR